MGGIIEFVVATRTPRHSARSDRKRDQHTRRAFEAGRRGSLGLGARGVALVLQTIR